MTPTSDPETSAAGSAGTPPTYRADMDTDCLKTPSERRAEQIESTYGARQDALNALRDAAEAYLDATRKHGAAVYAKHGPDSPPDDSPKWGDAFDAALALTRVA